jgi:hypothetical protein
MGKLKLDFKKIVFSELLISLLFSSLIFYLIVFVSPIFHLCSDLGSVGFDSSGNSGFSTPFCSPSDLQLKGFINQNFVLFYFASIFVPFLIGFFYYFIKVPIGLSFECLVFVSFYSLLYWILISFISFLVTGFR